MQTILIREKVPAGSLRTLNVVYIRIYILILFILLPLSLYSQTGFTEYQTFIDSNISNNFIYSNYDNQINSINFTSRINYSSKFKKVNIYIKNYYNSAITKLDTKFFRDFDNLKTGFEYRLFKNINISANFLGFLYSDEKNIQLKGSSSGYYFLSSRIDDKIHDAPFYAFLDAGYKNENQIGEYNNGLSLRGEFNIDNLDISKYYINSKFRFGYEELSPRLNNYFTAGLQADKSFSNELAANSFDGYFSRIKKDYYFPADDLTKMQFGINNNLEKRTETIIRAFDRFDYTISERSSLYFTILPYYRDVIKENEYIPVTLTSSPGNYDTRIQEVSFNGEGAVSFSLNTLSLQVKLNYLERDEKHFLFNQNRIGSIFIEEKKKVEASKNNHTSRLSANGNIFFDLSGKNRLELLGLASIMKYDTQSDENFDDRDELNFILYFAHRYNNLDNFQLRSSVDMNLYHTVYIFSQRSSNNNWNRILRLSSYSYFNPSKKFRTINTFSVLANYTVYDFEDILSDVKSYTFRQFNYKDSTIYNFTDKFAFKLYSEIKLYERGELNWSGFSVNPDSYIEDKVINPEFYYYLHNNIIFSAGYRFFDQKRFKYINGARIFDTFSRTHGPLMRVRFDFNNNSLIEIIGSYDYYYYGKDTPSSSNANLYLNVLWNL